MIRRIFSSIYSLNTPFFLHQLLVLFLSVLCANVAVSQTPQQIQQFRNLPQAQQEALAREYGVDLKAITQQNSAGPQPQFDQPAPIPRERIDQIPGGSLGQSYGERLNIEYSDDTNGTLDQEELELKELEPFGYSLFRQSPDAFTPALDIPIPADYVMGPGDTLIVQLYGKENANYSLVVDREGRILFPEIGPINLAGLKFSRAQEIINQVISEQMIGVKSSVTSGSLRTIRVFVLGEVINPGSYIVSSLSTMTNALFASGGIARVGSLRNIQLKRSGQLITTLDLYDLLLNGDTSKDERLLPGDVIFIPPIGEVASVRGEVKRPAIYELKNEKTLKELVQLSGGYLPAAFPNASKVERIDELGNRTVLDVNLSQVVGQNRPLKNGDTLIINPVLDSLENIITLNGHVKRPGRYSWQKDMWASQLIGSVASLKANPDLSIALIARETQPTRRLEVQYFNLQEAIDNPRSHNDIKLNPRDQLFVFGYEEDRGEVLEEVVAQLKIQADKFNKTELVRIQGHVRYPAEYPKSKGFSLQQLIKVAGGLTEKAFGLEAEITRYHYGDNPFQLIEHIPVSIFSNDSAFKLEPTDTVTIKQIPNYTEPETVNIEGEVAFPGEYTIQKGEVLSQVLQRAGGLTDYAFPGGAIFTRAELRNLEAQRLEELQTELEADLASQQLEQKDSGVVGEKADAEALLDDLKSLKPQGRMVIDLPAIVDGVALADVKLQDGDRVVIPRQKQAITVVGEVQFPTSHLYEGKLGVEDYIERSGGVNERADKSRVYVVKANGRVFLPNTKGWFKRDSVKIEAGDTVVVPIDTDRIETLTLWSSVSQIIYQMALGAAAVNSF